MRKVGYEVTGRKPVCVDFEDGRTVSFRPGARFHANSTNASVRRLLRVKEIRQLGAGEAVPVLPVKLGAPRKVTDVLKARDEVARARAIARAKMLKSKTAPPVIELPKPTPPPKLESTPAPKKTEKKKD